jgi:phosphoglycerol transferase MdoB-like AlkP superfamily enzyme
MLIKWRVPKTIQWIVKLFLIYLVIFTGFRVATVVCFKPAKTGLLELMPAFWLGLKYDLRWIAFILTPIAIFSLFPKFNPFRGERPKRFWTAYLGIITLLVLFFYGADFGQFAYVNARLNADALIFAEDPQESLQMVWQSYPIVWILIGLFGAVMMMIWMFRRTHVDVEEKNTNIHKFAYRRRWHLTAILLLGWFMYGFLTLRPLNFFRAFRLNDEFKSNLALNPMQNFFTTLRFRDPDYHTEAARYYPEMQKLLNLTENHKREQNPYARIAYPGSRGLECEPNVVLVICESFSMYKSSMSGNPLNATPYFNHLCHNGIFFNRCFTPTFGTARGVFATITGIPDVQLGKFSTRNEAAVNQRTIINEFDGYNKFYFIGGRSQFNNFSGLVRNINGVQIYEEGSFKSPKINVWGISDKNLFLEANDVLAKQEKPFFAIIQTADNHRPYNIPDEDTADFKAPQLPADSLLKYGFESQKEFTAFHYMDYCFRKFMEAASKQPYFNNTIFVFVGDHGVDGNALHIYPPAWTEQRLSDEHVPLLFYAPGFLPTEWHNETVSQIDVLPTIAGMMQEPYLNTTLGRDLLNETPKEPAAFIIYHAPGWIGVVNDQYFYRKNIRIKKDELVPVKFGLPPLSKQQEDSVKQHLSVLTSAYYETARWMLVNNGNR